MDKIKKISSYMTRVFNVLLFSVPMTLAMQWLFVSKKTTELPSTINMFGLFERTIQTPESYVNLSTVAWTLPLKTLGFFADVLGVLPLFLSLLLLKSIFKNYQLGEVFSTSNADKYKKLGWLALVDALIVKSLSHTLLILSVTLSNPPGDRYINIQFGTPNLKALFLGTLLIIISWIMREASKLHDEQTFTI